MGADGCALDAADGSTEETADGSGFEGLAENLGNGFVGMNGRLVEETLPKLVETFLQSFTGSLFEESAGDVHPTGAYQFFNGIGSAFGGKQGLNTRLATGEGQERGAHAGEHGGHLGGFVGLGVGHSLTGEGVVGIGVESAHALRSPGKGTSGDPGGLQGGHGLRGGFDSGEGKAYFGESLEQHASTDGHAKAGDGAGDGAGETSAGCVIAAGEFEPLLVDACHGGEVTGKLGSVGIARERGVGSGDLLRNGGGAGDEAGENLVLVFVQHATGLTDGFEVGGGLLGRGFGGKTGLLGVDQLHKLIEAGHGGRCESGDGSREKAGEGHRVFQGDDKSGSAARGGCKGWVVVHEGQNPHRGGSEVGLGLGEFGKSGFFLLRRGFGIGDGLGVGFLVEGQCGIDQQLTV